MTTYEGTHPTVLVRVADRQARIDERLAPAIEAIWECGFDTFTCCQDLAESNADWPRKLPHMAQWVESRRGWMLIDFPVTDGLAFLSAVANAGPRDAFYVRMTHWAAPDAWRVNVKPMDAAMFQDDLPSRFRLQLLQVSFPGSDLPEIVRRLRAHAEGRSVPPAPADWSTVGR
ncbi:hypothetical protein [Streptomyces sp. VRA16 Mangrove soil]|uniref:hypothetical protein n=1 Tax=Streptomyces sp. VRA16 Mangrove soil TaxID=2817434 RepID=UPI001A9F59AB|nr:hypothetical protein [Streptomyces sp. VRA16 Mangrove soil]MBO1336507.1 hypothetical protein [Streptomyces sp. VRA16 Mangrove soil]